MARTYLDIITDWFLRKTNHTVLFLSVSFCLLYLASIPISYEDNIPSYTVDIGHGRHAVIQIPPSKLLFQPEGNPVGQDSQSIAVYFEKKSGLDDLYNQIGNHGTHRKIVFVYPIFTQAAYGVNGFYYYYNGSCNLQCLTVSIPDKIDASYSASAKGANVLTLLNYSFITDIDIDKNPDILKNYDRVIMLHSEYVTQKEFDAITSHPNVIFFYPNALYAKVNVEYDKGTITLLRGHGYPNLNAKNGFDWKYDNSRFEYDYSCDHWNYYSRGNYTFLNCYPEYKVLSDSELLNLLKADDPTDLANDVSNWLTYQDDANASDNMLVNFDIHGHKIPHWVQNPALWVLNGAISRDEFADLLRYLSDNKMIS